MALTPPTTITGAPVEPALYGLFSVAPPREAAGRWEAGVHWEAALTCPDPTGVVGVNCADPDPPAVTSVTPTSGPTDGGTAITVTGSGFLAAAAGEPKQVTDGGPDWGEAEPFVVTAGASCSLPGRTEEAARDSATASLLLWEEARVENTIATGAAGVTPSFQGAEVVTAGPLTRRRGLAELENFIGSTYGGHGVVHMTRGAAIALSSFLDVRGGRLWTTAGSPVVVGSGYTGNGPDGAEAAEGTTWVYATPPVFVLRSEPYVNVGYDLIQNDRLAMAERTYLVGWDPCPVGAVQIDLE